jgi:cephalosporin hydroxylase
MDLWQDFLTNQGKAIHKWSHYFPIYERHFAPWRGRSLTFLEVGVAKGGSLAMWRRYFGPLAEVVGIDIDRKCKAHEAEGLAVRIGDQSDPRFLQSVIDEFGVPDVVLDDGSHQMDHIAATFDYLYPKMGKNAVYAVEDLHCAYWPKFGGGLSEPANFFNVAKGLVDKLNADHTEGQVTPDAFTRDTFGIAFYDSMVVFEKGRIPGKGAIEIVGGKSQVRARPARKPAGDPGTR